MICGNCQKVVDDDLVFCTECGARLQETINQTPTVLMTEPVIIRPTQPFEKPKSNLKWVALIIALIALPVSLGIVYLIVKNQSNQQITNKTPTNSTPPATKKPSQNKQTNAATSNAKSDNTSNNANTNIFPVENVNSNKTTDNTEIGILNDRISLSPNEHIAFPFKVDIKTEKPAKIVGKVEILQGESYEGYVFTQESYDEHFPDATYKMFSFGEGKISDVEQYLLKGDYVIVFVNKSENGVIIQAKFSQIPQ